jgi:branched-chain amino acid transport system permease protein
MLFLQLLVDGLQLGALYALMAVGFAMIFGSTRIFHYAHGTTYIIVGYLFYYLSEPLRVPWYLAAVAAAAAGVVFGVLLDRWMYRPIQRDEGSFFTVFVASFGIGVVVENVVIILFGASFVSISTPLTRASNIGGGIVVSYLGMLSVLVALLLFGFLNWFLARTDVGVALRALSENPDLVRGFRAQSAQTVAICLRDRLAAGGAGRAGRDLRHRPDARPRPSGGAHFHCGEHHRRHRLAARRRPRRAHSRPRREPRGVEALDRLERGVSFVILFCFILARPSGLFGTRARV